ncbi:MAG TPA: type I methionyl aminopeptidase [Chthoniobacteraceae bacterium]|nr:type I methionyl aminopeptidase [Chthoniobacteraceae bacterium]
MIPIKSPKEIEKMRRAGRCAAEVLRKTAQLVVPGVSTGEIDRAAAEFIAEAGCTSAFLNYRGFPGNICISLNEEVVHGIGSTRKIQYGDVVKLDIGVLKDGWVGDNATSVAVGMVPPEVSRLLEVTEASLKAAVAQALHNGRLGDIGAAVEEMVVANGFSVVREFVGHGVGRRLHEEPQIPNYGKRGSGPKLKAGMTLAIEPMVNLGTAGVTILDDGWTVVTKDGKASSHFEHTVLVTKGEPEILTWLE